MTKRTLSRLVLLVLAACGAAEPPAPEPPAASTDWIEVPLTDHTYREFTAGYQQDTLLVPVPADDRGLEVKLAMNEGDAIVYRWEVQGMDDARQLLAEFHGHTHREPGQPGTVMFYRQAHGGTEQGSLIAPFTGIHGWYFRNDSDRPALVRITVAGFYRRTD
jgi:hypothetical protein